METQTTASDAHPSAKNIQEDTTLYNQQNNPTAKKFLYNPKEYSFIGFFFTLIPVFIMSFRNSQVLPNGESIRNQMRTYLKIYIGGFVAYLLLLLWSIYDLATRLKEVAQSPEAITSSSLSSTIIDNGKYIFGIINLIILILVLKFLKKNEIPAYEDLKAKGQVEIKRLIGPIAIGFGVDILVYVVIMGIAGTIIASVLK